MTTSKTNVSYGLIGLCLGVVLAAGIVRDGLADVADGHRRQAAAQCIDSWHAWVRGTRTDMTLPDIEYCMLLSGIQPPPGLEDRMLASEMEREHADAEEQVRKREEELDVNMWWLNRTIAKNRLVALCGDDYEYDTEDCASDIDLLADGFPP